jgi:rhodanese-related sulfurtransferase
MKTGSAKLFRVHSGPRARDLSEFVVVLWVAICLAGVPRGLAGQGTNEPIPKPGNTVPKSSAGRRVGVDEFERLWREKNPVLDVRTKKEFDAGHIPGAVNLDVNSPEFLQKISALDKKKTYLVHCAAGVRSARACQKMSELGFEHLIDLAPGFREWEKAGKKVEK